MATIGEAFSAAAKKEPKLETSRIPVTLDDAPSEETFDQLVRLLKGHSSAVPVIFNCQVLIDILFFLHKIIKNGILHI